MAESCLLIKASCVGDGAHLVKKGAAAGADLQLRAGIPGEGAALQS